MPTSKGRYIYWDTCVFVAHLNKEVGRVDVIDNLWVEIAEERENKIITSVVTRIEAVFSQTEKASKILDPSTETILADYWGNPVLQFVELFSDIAARAFQLQRQALAMNLSLKPMDAIHLSTAIWVHNNIHPIHELHTYDKPLTECQPLAPFNICEPYVTQPRLDL